MNPRSVMQNQQLVPRSEQTYFYSDSSTDTGQAIALKVHQTVVYITLSDATDTATFTLTLPSVAEAKGMTYTIRVLDSAGGGTIQDRDDSLEWSDKTNDADGEYIVLYSDGRQWHVLVTDM